MHNIDESTGRAGIAYVGAKPWHKLGTEMEPGMPLEVWMEKAGLDWEVAKARVQYIPEDGSEPVIFPNRQALYRTDIRLGLSVVSDQYKPVQPATVIDFYRLLIEKNGMEMETAGSLREGRIIWALARTGMTSRIMGQDQLDTYILLATSYDGTMATSARQTSVRVVCNNTLDFAYQGGTNVIKVPHTSDFDIEKVQIDLGVHPDHQAQWERQVEEWANTPVNRKELTAYFLALITDEEVAIDNMPTAIARQLKRMQEAYEGAPGQDYRSARGTVWGAINAVTFMEDHSRRETKEGGRLTSSWFGPGLSRKRKAVDLANKLVKGEDLLAA